MRELTRVVCRQHEVTILRGHVSSDHVHLLVSIPPQVTISRLVPWLKGPEFAPSARRVCPSEKSFLGPARVGTGYFCCSSGNVTDEASKKYIEEQGEEKDDDFKVEGGT